jgi:HEAT repeat protein
MPLFGSPNVATLKDRKDVQGLIKALGNQKDLGVRRAAAEALGQIGDAQAVGPLIAAIKNDARMNYCGSLALNEIRDARAVEALISAIKDADPAARAAAAHALIKFGDTRAIKPLISALGDYDGSVLAYAIRALARIGAPATVPLLGALKYWSEGGPEVHSEQGNVIVRNYVFGLLVAIGADAVEPLSATLRDQSENMRAIAAGALGEIRDTRAVKPLTAALKDESDWVRTRAVEALGKIGAAE